VTATWLNVSPTGGSSAGAVGEVSLLMYTSFGEKIAPRESVRDKFIETFPPDPETFPSNFKYQPHLLQLEKKVREQGREW